MVLGWLLGQSEEPAPEEAAKPDLRRQSTTPELRRQSTKPGLERQSTQGSFYNRPRMNTAEVAADRRQSMAKLLVPQWLKAAPRAAAKAYVLRVNSLLPHKKRLTAAAMLTEKAKEMVELGVQVPSPLAGFTIQQLNLPTKVILFSRASSLGGKTLDVEKVSKCAAGDTLFIRGTPHDLAEIATMKDGGIFLNKPREIEDASGKLQAQRESLALAGAELYDRLLSAWLAHRKSSRLAIAMQKAYRGRSVRIWSVPQAAWVLMRCRLMRNISSQIALEMVLAKYAKPIIDKRRLMGWTELSKKAKPNMRRQSTAASMPVPVVAATTTEGPAAAPEASTAEVVEEEEPEWAQGFGLLDLLAARKGVMARLYVSAINKLLMAAPEASEIGAPLGMHELLVDSHTCCVTAKLYANEVTIGSLNLPADVIIERMTINKRNINTPATGGKRIDPDQKILKGDELTLRALPHRLVLVCDVPKGGGQLSLLTKPKTTAADAIARRRAKLLDSTVELAKGLQAIVRSRIRQRQEAYQNLSALKFQRATLTHPSRLARLELAPPPQGVKARLTMATTDKGRQRVRKEGPYKRAERPKVEVVEEVKEKKKLPPEAKASHHKGKGGAGKGKGSSPSSSPKGKKAGAGKAKEGGKKSGSSPPPARPPPVSKADQALAASMAARKKKAEAKKVEEAKKAEVAKMAASLSSAAAQEKAAMEEQIAALQAKMAEGHMLTVEEFALLESALEGEAAAEAPSPSPAKPSPPKARTSTKSPPKDKKEKSPPKAIMINGRMALLATPGAKAAMGSKARKKGEALEIAKPINRFRDWEGYAAAEAQKRQRRNSLTGVSPVPVVMSGE